MKNLTQRIQLQNLAKVISLMETAREILADTAGQTNGSVSGTFQSFAEEIEDLLESDNGEAGLRAYARQVHKNSFLKNVAH